MDINTEYLKIAKELWQIAKERSKESASPYELVDLWIRIKSLEELLSTVKKGLEGAAIADAARSEGEKLAWECARVAAISPKEGTFLTRLSALAEGKNSASSKAISEYLESLTN